MNEEEEDDDDDGGRLGIDGVMEFVINCLRPFSLLHTDLPNGGFDPVKKQQRRHLLNASNPKL